MNTQRKKMHLQSRINNMQFNAPWGHSVHKANMNPFLLLHIKQMHQRVIKDYSGPTEHISHSSSLSFSFDSEISWCFSSIPLTPYPGEMCTAGQNFSVIHYFHVMAASGSRAWEFYLEWTGVSTTSLRLWGCSEQCANILHDIKKSQ